MTRVPADGYRETAAHVKTASHVPADFFSAEAAGLRWLAETRTVEVAAVIAVSQAELVLERLTEVPATAEAAAGFGTALAGLHRAACPPHGTLPPGADRYYFGPLSQPLVIDTAISDSMGHSTAVRLESLARRLPQPSPALTRVIERLDAGEFDDDAPPARLHGDLWAGNLLFSDRGPALIDPAAISGHPLVDLAMLELFGAPHLPEILTAWAAAYDTADLGPDWRERIGLHQLFGLTAHAVLFGGGYVAAAEALARRYS